MELTNELKTSVAEARVYLVKHAELSLAPRINILRAFGKKNENRAKQRRVNLAILCVNKVLPLWNDIYPDNDLPQQFLELIKQVMAGQVSEEKANERVNLDWVKLEDMDRDNYAHSVGFAAIKTVYVATSDEKWLEIDDEWEEIEENDFSDYDFDPYRWTVSYHASLAYGEEKTERTKEFWEWYLNEAVPQAFNSIV